MSRELEDDWNRLALFESRVEEMLGQSMRKQTDWSDGGAETAEAQQGGLPPPAGELSSPLSEMPSQEASPLRRTVTPNIDRAVLRLRTHLCVDQASPAKPTLQSIYDKLVAHFCVELNDDSKDFVKKVFTTKVSTVRERPEPKRMAASLGPRAHVGKRKGERCPSLSLDPVRKNRRWRR